MYTVWLEFRKLRFINLLNFKNTIRVITFIQSSVVESLYSLGNEGEKKCPIDYKPINDPTECAAAAQEFQYVWNEDDGLWDTNSVCYYCSGCSPKDVRLSPDHGGMAQWMCKKGK